MENSNISKIVWLDLSSKRLVISTDITETHRVPYKIYKPQSYSIETEESYLEFLEKVNQKIIGELIDTKGWEGKEYINIVFGITNGWEDRNKKVEIKPNIEYNNFTILQRLWSKVFIYKSLKDFANKAEDLFKKQEINMCDISVLNKEKSKSVITFHCREFHDIQMVVNTGSRKFEVLEIYYLGDSDEIFCKDIVKITIEDIEEEVLRIQRKLKFMKSLHEFFGLTIKSNIENNSNNKDLEQKDFMAELQTYH